MDVIIGQKLNNWLKSFSGIFGKVETPIVEKQEIEIAKVSWYSRIFGKVETPSVEKQEIEIVKVSWYRSLLDKYRF